MAPIPPDAVKLFTDMISLTFDNWHSFQLSVEAGMGGPRTAEKLTWMVEMVGELFTENELNLTPTDVEEYLAELLDNEFETVIQDGSLEMVCTNLCSSFQQITAGNLTSVQERIQTLRQNKEAAKQQREQARRSQPQQPDAHDDDDEDMDVEETSGGQASRSSRQAVTEDEEEVEDGWTKVGKTRRH